jgi:hypothetical protein
LLKGGRVPEFSFGLIVAGVDFSDDDVVNRLYDAGVDDASFAFRSGSSLALFDREAESFAAAMLSAVVDIERTLPDARVCGIQSDDLLTPTGVAELSGRTRQSVHQHIRGQRGAGFPPPVAWADCDRALWLRSDVSNWISHSDAPHDQASWAGVAGGAFHLARAACFSGAEAFTPGLALAVERYLVFCSADSSDRKHVTDALREMADRIERSESPLLDA